MSSLSMKWNRKMMARPVLQKRRNILKLINLYRENRLLWDRSRAGYEDRNARKAAWRDIGNRLPGNVDEVKQKMLTLLSTYERERKKERCPFCCRRDPHPREVYRSKWFAYNSFDFLCNVKTKPARGPTVYDSDDDSENENENRINAVFIKEEPNAFEPEGAEYDAKEPVIGVDGSVDKRNDGESPDGDSLNFGTHFLAEVVDSSPPKIPVRRITVIKRKRPSSPSSDQTDHDPDPPTSAAVVVDECSTFADHVRTKLEKFDGPSRAVIMHRINGAIFEAEMKKYGGRRHDIASRAAYSVSVDPHPVKRTWLQPVLRIPKIDIDNTITLD